MMCAVPSVFPAQPGSSKLHDGWWAYKDAVQGSFVPGKVLLWDPFTPPPTQQQICLWIPTYCTPTNVFWWLCRLLFLPLDHSCRCFFFPVNHTTTQPHVTPVHMKWGCYNNVCITIMVTDSAVSVDNGWWFVNKTHWRRILWALVQGVSCMTCSAAEMFAGCKW